MELNSGEWLCYPAKVGKLVIMVYFHLTFFELGLSMCNLFQLADDTDLEKKPDALFIYGVPGNVLDGLSEYPTVFYHDSGYETSGPREAATELLKIIGVTG